MTLPPDDRDYPERDYTERDDRPDFDRPFERPRLDFGRDDDPASRPVFDDDEPYEDAPPPERYSDEPDLGDDDYDDDDFGGEPVRSAPNPLRLDPPLFAPVVFDDDDPPRRGFRRGGGGGGDGGEGRSPGRYESDAGLIRVLALIAVLGIVILALVLPFSPISVLGGDDGDDSPTGISARVSDDMPALPEGLVALSKLYVITVQEGIAGPLSVEVQLTEANTDSANLAYYAWDGSAWTRVGSVQLAAGGDSVTGAIPAASASIAVLRRTALAHSMAMIVGPGETPDPAGLTAASLIVVTAGTLEEDGSVLADVASLRSAQQVAGDRPVYLGVSGDAAAAGVFGSATDTSGHVSDLVAVAETQDAAGLYLEYSGVTDAAGFTAFATALAQQLHAVERGLIIGAPLEGSEYDWAGLLPVVDGLWLQAPANPTAYYAAIDSVLADRGVTEGTKVSIVLDRSSSIASPDGTVAAISLVDGLTIASSVDFNVDAIGAGRPVTLRTAYLGGGADRQLHWSDDARAVTFTFTTDEGDSTVWFQNQYSFAYALNAAGSAGFGGVAVRDAAAGGSKPDVWQPLAAFVEEGTVQLLRPYGPYLTPCWEAPEGAIEGQPECWTAETDTTAIVWRAPEEDGAYTVRLVVSEGTMFVGQEVVLRVGDTPDGEPTETATPEPTEDPTDTPTPAPTEEATPEPTEEPTGTATPTATATPSPTASATQTPAPTSTAGPPGPGGN